MVQSGFDASKSSIVLGSYRCHDLLAASGPKTGPRTLPKHAGVCRTRHEYAGTGPIRQRKTPTENGWGCVVVEAAGIEPASASPTFQDLHA